jgi:hypothetical protein
MDVKGRKMRRAGSVARVGETVNEYNILVRKYVAKRQLGDIDTDGRLIFNDSERIMV